MLAAVFEPTKGRGADDTHPFRVITGRIRLADMVGQTFREPIDDKEENATILLRP